MEEYAEGLRVVPELYFLIAKFLSGGPLKETAKTLLKELESVEVLPRRLDWQGEEHPQSFQELASQYTDVSWTRLASVCDRALRLARSASNLSPRPLPAPRGDDSDASAAASPPRPGAPTPAQTDLSERLTARLSLLSETLVRPRPKYASHKQDHSVVRRMVYREMGVGPAALPGGAGGQAMFSPRLLSGLQLQRRTLGHLSAVYCLVFDCTGRYVVTGADDLLVKVWNALDGRLLATLRGAGAEITDVCASHDGALLAAGSVERLVRVWCLATGAPRAVLSAHAGTITAVHWSPGGCDTRWLASTSTDGSVAFWTCALDGQFLSQPVQYVERTRPGACHMICAAWSAGGAMLAAGSADHHVRVYLVGGRGPGGPRRILEAAVHSDAVDSVAWAHRGLRLVSGSKDGSAALWALHATQWRHRLLLPAAAGDKRLKVTMVCWDRSDAYVITAVSDCTIRVWCSLTCAQVACLRGHRDEAYVLEAHPFLPHVLLSAGHDGQLLVWDAPNAEILASFHNHIEGQGDGAIFDAKWGGGATVAATDSHGHLLLLGLGEGAPLLKKLPHELFFHTDYRPLVRDALGGALDEQTELPPHLMPPPFLVDVEGAPHPPQLQRLVPGRELLPPQHLVPHAPHARLDRLIEELAGEREGPGAGPWRGEGVRHTGGLWQRGELTLQHSTRAIVPPLPPARARPRARASLEMYELEQAWYRREMRRRPVMISTAAAHGGGGGGGGPRRRAGRPHQQRPRPRPRPRAEPQIRTEEPPSPESLSGSDTSDSSVRLSGVSHSASDRSRQAGSTASDHSSSSSSSSSQYSDWEAGAALAPPARARRRPLPATRYSPTVPSVPKRPDRSSPVPGSSAVPEPEELPEAYRPGEWLTAVCPRKAPYHPQMGDECLYFRLGHQRYFEAVAEKDLYKINPRDKPWERTNIHECELVKVVGIKYVIKPPRVVSLRLSCVLEPRSFTVKYHDMPDVIDFLVLRQQYETATARQWARPDRFRCMIDDSWWTGVVLERAGPGPGGGPPSAAPTAAPSAAPSAAPAAPPGPCAAFSAQAAPHFLSLRVRWDNGEVERLSPWDLEPIDPERLPSEPGGSVPVLPHELEAVLYRAAPHEWPPRGDRAAACRAVAHHVSQVMSLSVAEPFVAPVDLQQYPAYARVVPYPIDLATIRARFDNLFYRRAAAAQFDVRYLASNAEQFNEPHSAIVRQARLVTDLLLQLISHWREVDVVSQYRLLAASYHSSDDEPLATKSRSKKSAEENGSWRSWCSNMLRELMSSSDAAPFTRPVCRTLAPDYDSVVSHPMDLGTVQSRLSTGYYSSRDQVAADIRRVIANSRLYNTNKRSRIYSMTVRLSALFESLWSRAPPSPRPVRDTRRMRRQRRARRDTDKVNGVEDHEPSTIDPSNAASDSSESPLVNLGHSRPSRGGRPSRDDSWDSDAPLGDRGKGKGIGKKSKSSASSEPAPGPSRLTRTGPSEQTGASARNGLDSYSEDSSPARRPPPAHQPRRQENGSTRKSRKRRLASHSATSSGTSSGSSSRWRTKRSKPKRTRERFISGSSSSGSSSSSVTMNSEPRHYESDRSYHPRYSSDDDAPLHLYRQRAEGGAGEGEGAEAEAGPSTARRKHYRHKKGGVSLRARSPRRYNEDSEDDSVAAISKRQHRASHHQHARRRQLLRARERHSHQPLSAPHSDHNYINGELPPPPPPPPPPPRPRAAPASSSASRTPSPSTHNSAAGHSTHNGEVTPVSISSRGRVRKLTAKARGLLQD